MNQLAELKLLRVKQAGLSEPLIFLDDNGILHMDQGHYQKLTVERIDLNVAKCKELIGTNKAPMLVYGNNVLGLDYAGARRAATGPMTEICSAMAAVTKTRLEEYLAYIFTAHNPPYPFKAFRDEASAIAWLQKVTRQQEMEHQLAQQTH